MKRRNCMVFVLILLTICSISRVKGQSLSVKSMHEDMIFLQKNTNQYCAFLPFLENRTHTSVNNELDSLKNEITHPKNTEEFVDIIRQALNLLYDGHSKIATKDQIIWYSTEDHYLKAIGNVEIADTINANRNYNITTNNVFSKLKCWLKTKYIDGKYYNVRPFSYNGQSILSGEIISAINGIPINDYIQQNYKSMYYLLWDPSKEQWYDELFIFSIPQLLNSNEFILTIGNKEIQLSYNTQLTDLKFEHSQTYKPLIQILEDDILYVRMPQMSNSLFYIEEIKRLYSSEVKKIVFDIRSNGGGDDGVWQDILKSIISEPLTYQYKVGIKCDEDIMNAVSSFGVIKEEKTSELCVLTEDRTLEPNDNSLLFKGKIYVLQDKYTYSAAAALSSLAWQNDDIILVGERAALLAGYTFPAAMFRLPNSKIVFKLAFSVDMVGGEINPYMDKVEVEILENDINTYLDKIFNYDCFSNEYLLNKDKLIQYVREN